MKPEDIPPRTLMALALSEAIKNIRQADACLMSVKDLMYQEAEQDSTSMLEKMKTAYTKQHSKFRSQQIVDVNNDKEAEKP